MRFPPVTSSPSPSISPSQSPSPSPSPSVSPSPSPSPQPGGCAATYTVGNQWQGNFQGNVTVRNTGSTTTNSWTVTWTFQNGQVISQLWGGDWSQNGGNVTVRNLNWNANIPAGGTISFGFIASWNGTNGQPTNVTCTRT
ncbi:cellulose binding domain-containing protein [Allorhizocola rhizosphaerae]|uniref:cellulose binding domain-containing protein n=1 Tax=Allorhizocola rhizosphaerae TaxID=1872709 RepID=UPI003CCC8D7E